MGAYFAHVVWRLYINIVCSSGVGCGRDRETAGTERQRERESLGEREVGGATRDRVHGKEDMENYQSVNCIHI